MSSGKILVAQSGGPTAVFNQSLVGVALDARRFQNVKRVYGARHGVRGIVNENLVDLTQETSHNLEAVAGKTRTMEDALITASGTDVTDAFRMYLRPLLGSDMPDAYRLRNNPVAKVLNAWPTQA